MELKKKETTDIILRCFFKVYNTLGYGFLEKVYENAMMIELTKAGLIAQNQYKIKVFYEGTNVGDYYADIMVDQAVIIELKAAECIVAENEYQLVNYLKATTIETGLLLNFGRKPEFRRKVFSNVNKRV
jgi:GxxExxY protein